MLLGNGLPPFGVIQVGIHNHELVAVGSPGDLIVAVHRHTVCVLEDLVADILVADGDPGLVLLGLGLLLGNLDGLIAF